MGHHTQTNVCSLEWYWLRERFCHVNWFYPHEDFTLNFNKMRFITRRYLRSLSSFLVFWNIISMSIDFSREFILYKTCLKYAFDLNKIMTFLFADINLLFLLDLIIIWYSLISFATHQDIYRMSEHQCTCNITNRFIYNIHRNRLTNK